MRLENLYKNFGESTPEEQAEYIAAYRLRRAEELRVAAPPPRAKKATTTSAKLSKIDISDEEKILMKKLGLTKKDIIALRSIPTTDEQVEDDGNLFEDGTFSEEADDE